MRGISPEDWWHFGQGAEDLDSSLRELEKAARHQTLLCCEETLSAIKPMRFALFVLFTLFILTCLGGTVAALFVAEARELPKLLAAFSEVASAGAAALGAIGLYLRWMEREVFATLRSMTSLDRRLLD